MRYCYSSSEWNMMTCAKRGMQEMISSYIVECTTTGIYVLYARSPPKILRWRLRWLLLVIVDYC